MKRLLNSSDINYILDYSWVTKKDKIHLTLHRRKNVCSNYKLKSTLSVPIGHFPELEAVLA